VRRITGPGPVGCAGRPSGRALRGLVPLALLLPLVLSACAGAGTATPTGAPATNGQVGPGQTASTGTATASDQRFPEILAVELRPTTDGYDVVVTISSPYDTPDRYADGWRVLAPDGTTLGEHELGHDHADEQPFTRTQRSVSIPDEVTQVTVEGRDLLHGYGGGTVTVAVP
uniref:hypothetical protein n=1 Tax=Actinotalea sp. TaxID=1872145 RepID=UPI00356A77DD